MLHAARLANCDEFVEKLPDGWNSRIGENGCELSGGERQRISIARAFSKRRADYSFWMKPLLLLMWKMKH